ncbi:hypothetical protein AB0D13_15190 [Streptomyces sp. NPDC048430]|uniref:hypothetical protein n=1 Tax=Streptomyces sp. NPDC048430 TaxID=3155388 RepID=UPI003432AD86
MAEPLSFGRDLGIEPREVGELHIGEGDMQAMTAPAPAADVGMPQRAGKDHHLLLARADVPSGEQFTGHLSRQELAGDQGGQQQPCHRC